MKIAVSIVARRTPLARWSRFNFKKPKKAKRFKMAPNAKILPRYPCSCAICKVVRRLSFENIKTYAMTPTIFAIKPTVNPMKNIF